jgi:hypothetical protein
MNLVENLNVPWLSQRPLLGQMSQHTPEHKIKLYIWEKRNQYHDSAL